MAHWFIAIYGRSVCATLWVNVAARMTQLCLVCYVVVECECMDMLYPELPRQLSLLSYNHPCTYILLQTYICYPTHTSC